MYERPPPAVEPRPTWVMRYVAILPLVLATCSGLVLLPLGVSLVSAGDSVDWLRIPARLIVLAVISSITFVASLGVLLGRRRGWNPNLMTLLWLASLIGSVAIFFAVIRL